MDPAAQLHRSNKIKLTWGLISLIGPSALILVTLIAYAIINAIVTASGGDPVGSPSTFMTIVNIILYLIGAISVLTWLPGIVLGIVLLATRK